MTVETAADRRTFLADFGEMVTYTVAGGTPVQLIGLASAAWVELSELSGTGIAARGTALKVAEEDLPAGAGQFDEVVRADGAVYRVAEPRPDGTGFTVLVLERI